MTSMAASSTEEVVTRGGPSAPVELDQVRAVLGDLGANERIVEVVVSVLRKMLDENRDLQLQLLKFLGSRSKSEKVDPNQLRLLLEGLDPQTRGPATPEPPSSEQTAPPADRPRRKPTGRHPVPPNLPVNEQIHRPAESELVCSGCGSRKNCIGSEKDDVIDYVPASLVVNRHIREKYACPRGCAGNVVIGAVADKPIEGGLPGYGLLAHLLVSKYQYHLPLNRLVRVYEPHGVVFAKSTLCGWVRAGAELVEPLSDRILLKALGAHVLQVDDTGLRVLDKLAPGGSKKGHMWILLGDGRFAAFRYTETWEGEAARALLSTRRGWLQGDAYKGYDQLYVGGRVIEVGCWSHARRYYIKALDGGDARAAVMIAEIRKLFDVEREAKERGLSFADRLALRLEKSRPVLDDIGEWVERMIAQETPKSPLAKALGYTKNQWAALTRLLEDGALEIENNAAERGLRGIACGRKNWQFAGSDEGARRAGHLYSVIATCILHGVDPWLYLRHILELLSGDFPASRLDELLPEVWVESHPKARRSVPYKPPTAAAA